MKIPLEFERLSKRDLIRLILVEREAFDKRIDELERRLLAYENAHTPSSKQDKRKYPKREKTGNWVGRPKGYKGSTREVPEPTESKTLSLEVCPDCQISLGKPERIQRKVIEEIPEPQPLRVIEFFIPHYHCKNCDKEVVPSHPELPSEGRLGNNLQAQISLMKYEDRLPYRKIVQTLNRQHCLSLTPATVLDITRRVADKLRSVYEEIKEEVKNSSATNADETGIKVRGEKWWAWIFVTTASVLFLIRKSRGQKPIEEALGENYQGILGCDGWASYPKCVEKIQRCWAHLLREAKWYAEKYEGQARLLYKGLCKIFKRIQKITTETCKAWKTRTHNWCKKEIQSWINASKAHKELKKFITKIENGSEHWLTRIQHPEIEPTNNKAERALRELVVQRKISSLWNQKGITIKETIMSVLATWQLKGLNTFSMLRQTLSS